MALLDRIKSPFGTKQTGVHTIEALPPDTQEQSEPETPRQRWNEPKKNIGRVAATFWCFILLGANDNSYGVLIPYLETYYHVSYLQVSLIFLSPVAGFIISTLANHAIHTRYGRRGVILIAGTSHIVAYTVASQHPPFYALVIVYILVGLGSGAKQAAWNSFVGRMHHANELLGLLHGFYGLGATLTPVVAGILFTKHNWQWFMFYYIMIGMATADFVFSLLAFKDQTAKAFNEANPIEMQQNTPTDLESSTTNSKPKPSGSRITRLIHDIKNSYTLQCLRNRVVALCSCYLLAYVGSEVALGGWIVTFMIKVRHGSSFASGLTSSGLWAGITTGRMTLGFITGRFFKSEKHAVIVYLVMAMVMELLFWLIPNFVASAVSAAFLGFFLGPLYPAVIICITKLLPRSMQVSAIGVCSAIGASGASVIPFLVGAIADAKGVAVLQPIIFALLVLCLLLWLLMPKL